MTRSDTEREFSDTGVPRSDDRLTHSGNKLTRSATGLTLSDIKLRRTDMRFRGTEGGVRTKIIWLIKDIGTSGLYDIIGLVSYKRVTSK